jgi:hypothetical protein
MAKNFNPRWGRGMDLYNNHLIIKNSEKEHVKVEPISNELFSSKYKIG